MDLKHLLAYAAPYRWRLALAGAFMIAETAAVLAVPWIGGRFAGSILSERQTEIAWLVLALLAALGLQAVLRFANGCVSSRTAERLLADLRIRIYDHLQSLPIGYHQQRRQGEILALMTYEVAQLSGFLTGTLLRIVPLLLTVAGSVVLMFRLDPVLAFLVAGSIPVFYLLLKILGRRLRPLATELQRAHAGAVAIAEESLGMLPAIKAFTREAEESRRYACQVQHVMHLSTTQQRIYITLEPTVQLAAASGAVLLLWLASGKLAAGGLNPADLVSFLLYAALLTRPVSALAGVYGQVQVARGTISRLHGVLNEAPEPDTATAPELRQVRGDIEFRHISFAYPDRRPLLENVSLHVRAGETIALTGDNGAGKTTLIHLLLRLYQPRSGCILVDGTDIASVSLKSLRRQIGIVPQHTLLFNGSVRDNIGFGKVGASQAEVENAARLAQAHEFIAALPHGYETIIGDHGVRLSGGQRQRIALARALLKDPPILILDEATSMFDPDGEAAFIADCHEALADRTVILISHRPASLALADRILRMTAGGKLEEMFTNCHNLGLCGSPPPIRMLPVQTFGAAAVQQEDR